MGDLATILQNYSASLCRGLRVEKLRRTLEDHCYDGTELHSAIDQILPGLANAAPLAAAAIKAEIRSRYQNSIPIDIAIELVMAFLETDRGAE